MIDITREKILPLAEAAKFLPIRPSAATMWRWREKGVRGKRLESIRIGNRVYTSLEAISRFAVHCGGNAAGCRLRTPTQRERSIRQAEKYLAQFGVK